MTKTVTLQNGTSFPCSEGETILSAASKNGIIIEHSCRTGRCGICKAPVIRGETEKIISETFLTSEELLKGHILTCCRVVKSDLQLDIEDVGELSKYRARTLPARIDSIRKLSRDVLEIILRTPPTSTISFRGGQYIDVIGPAGVRRSYSLANSPREDGKLKLEIRQVENGVLSRYWFNEAKVNDLLRLEGPIGTFFLRPKTIKNLIFLATGTGIAPVKAILEELRSTAGVSFVYDKIYLYWGARFEDDLYWFPEFDDLQLKFVPVLSRSEKWEGRKGYVQQALLDDNIDLNNAVVYACGSEAMIKSAKVSLTAAGLSQKQFYSDAFLSSG